MSTTIATASPRNGELILPATRNRMAKHVADNILRVLPVLPARVDRQMFCANAVAAANELATDCDPNSVLLSVFNASRMGLMIGGPLGLAYFVPFKGKCTLVIGYRGFLDLAFGGGWLRQVYADVILQGESFRQWANEDGAHLHHDIGLDRIATRENLVGAYCVYRSVNGRGVRVLPRSTIDRTDKRENVWQTNYEEMVRKTAIRRAAKDWKLTPQLALAVELDEQAERGEVPTGAIEMQGEIRRGASLSQLPD